METEIKPTRKPRKKKETLEEKFQFPQSLVSKFMSDSMFPSGRKDVLWCPGDVLAVPNLRDDWKVIIEYMSFDEILGMHPIFLSAEFADLRKEPDVMQFKMDKLMEACCGLDEFEETPDNLKYYCSGEEGYKPYSYQAASALTQISLGRKIYAMWGKPLPYLFSLKLRYEAGQIAKSTPNYLKYERYKFREYKKSANGVVFAFYDPSKHTLRQLFDETNILANPKTAEFKEGFDFSDLKQINRIDYNIYDPISYDWFLFELRQKEMARFIKEVSPNHDFGYYEANLFELFAERGKRIRLWHLKLMRKAGKKGLLFGGGVLSALLWITLTFWVSIPVLIVLGFLLTAGNKEQIWPDSSDKHIRRSFIVSEAPENVGLPYLGGTSDEYQYECLCKREHWCYNDFILEDYDRAYFEKFIEDYNLAVPGIN